MFGTPCICLWLWGYFLRGAVFLLGGLYVRRRLAPPGLEGLLELSTFSVARFLFLFSPTTSLGWAASAWALSLSRTLGFSAAIFTEELLPVRQEIKARGMEGGEGEKERKDREMAVQRGWVLIQILSVLKTQVASLRFRAYSFGNCICNFDMSIPKYNGIDMPNWTPFEMQTFYKTWPTQHFLSMSKNTAIWSAVKRTVLLCVETHTDTQKFPVETWGTNIWNFLQIRGPKQKGVTDNIVHVHTHYPWDPNCLNSSLMGSQETTPPPCLSACRTTALWLHMLMDTRVCPA